MAASVGFFRTSVRTLSLSKCWPTGSTAPTDRAAACCLSQRWSVPAAAPVGVSCQQLRYISRKRQVKIPPKPLAFDLSTDLDMQGGLDKTRPVPAMQHSSTLEGAPEPIKKIFSLEFASRRASLETQLHEVDRRFEQHPGDIASLEVQVARLTVLIRNSIDHVEAQRHDARGRRVMNHRLQKRKRLLKFLRREDYGKFEEVCRELQIKYVPAPTSVWPQSRKAKRKDDVVKQAIALRRQKLEALKDSLGEEERVYVEEKERVLSEIQSQLNSLDGEKLREDEELSGLVEKFGSVSVDKSRA